MTTVTPYQPASTGRLTFGGILNSEWIKLRTLRSTLWCYLVAFVLTVGIGALLAGFISTSGRFAGDSASALGLQSITAGINLGQLVVAVLGVLVISGEYGTGMIRSTLTAVPKRLPALWAKVLVFGVVTFVVSLVALAVTALIVAPLLGGKGIHFDLASSTIFLPILGAAGYLALIGVLSLAIGTIIRNSAGGIAISLGLILVLPTIITIFSAVTQAQWVSNLGQFLPNAAGARMYAFISANESIPAGAVSLTAVEGFLVLLAWIVVLLAAAALLLKRRDA